MNSARRKLIDAAWVLGGDWVGGDTGSGDYTTFDWVNGVGKGATITPAGGDTGKTLFVPNAGLRAENPFGTASGYGTEGRLYSATQSSSTSAYAIQFTNNLSHGQIFSNVKPIARSLRCVRS